MPKPITRRDFLNGAALTVAAGATLSPQELLALEAGDSSSSVIGKDYYPPTRTGIAAPQFCHSPARGLLGRAGARPLACAE